MLSLPYIYFQLMFLTLQNLCTSLFSLVTSSSFCFSARLLPESSPFPCTLAQEVKVICSIYMQICHSLTPKFIFSTRSTYPTIYLISLPCFVGISNFSVVEFWRTLISLPPNYLKSVLLLYLLS